MMHPQKIPNIERVPTKGGWTITTYILPDCRETFVFTVTKRQKRTHRNAVAGFRLCQSMLCMGGIQASRTHAGAHKRRCAKLHTVSIPHARARLFMWGTGNVSSSPRTDGMSAELLEWRSAFTSRRKQQVVARMRWPQSFEIPHEGPFIER